MPDTPITLWVNGAITEAGCYALAVFVDEDRAVTLDTRDAVYAYASTIIAACERAEFDAAIVAQMTRKLQMPVEMATSMVADLRSERPPLNEAAIAPFRLLPGVSATSGKPFLGLFVGGRQVGQWDPDDGRQHAMHIMTGAEVVELDTAYYRYMVEKVGTEPGRARSVISDLANFRDR